MTRGRVLQKFLPEPIRKVSGEGEGGLAVWLAVRPPQSEEAKVKWQGELLGLWKNVEEESINASYFQVCAWDQCWVIVQDNTASS